MNDLESSRTHPPQLSEEVWIRLHEFAADELSRYRDVQWQVPSVAIVFLFALSSAIGTDYIGDLIRSRPYRLEGGFTVLVVALWLFVVFFMHHCERNRQKMYDLLLFLEREMKVTDHIKGIIAPTASAKERKWRAIARKKFVLAYPIYAITTLVSVLSLCLIWFKK